MQTLTAEYIFGEAEKRQELLEKQKVFLQEAFKRPEMLFRDSDKFLKSTRNLFFDMMHYWDSDRSQTSLHQLQMWIASPLNEFVQEWSRLRGVKHAVTVKVRTPNQFPSLYAVYLGSSELLQFNPFEKFYGVREPAKEQEDIQNTYAEINARRAENLKRIEDQIASYEKMKTDPHRSVGEHHNKMRAESGVPFLANLSNRLLDHWLFLSKKQTAISNIDGQIASLRSQLDNELKSQYPVAPLEETIAENQKNRETSQALIPLFNEYGYRLETIKAKLY